MRSVAIVGCGPAGLSAAIALHEVGLQVTLFEQFDQPRPVGSGLMLQPTGLRVLERWGLRHEAEVLGQRIDGMLGRIAPNGKVILDITYDVLNKANQEPLYGVAIHRASLFHILFDAVKKRNIDVQTNARIHSVKRTGSGNDIRSELIDHHDSVYRENFDLVVDASGTHSNIAGTLGSRGKLSQLDYGALWTTVRMDSNAFNPGLLEQRYQGAGVMVGVLPCGQLPQESTPRATLFWSIRSDQFEEFQKDGIGVWKDQVCKIWPAVSSLLNEIHHTDELVFTTYSHHTMRQPYTPGIVFIGDAAHATSPQLGQGANMALLDSLALAQAFNKDSSFERFAPLYGRMRSNHVKLFQTASAVLTPFYQSDSRMLPAIRDTLFEPVSALPLARKMVTSLGAGLLTKPIERIDKLGL